MPIAIGDKVYDDEVQYKMGSIGIKPVEGDPEGQPSIVRTMPSGASTEPAGALKSVPGTGTPANQYETSLSPAEETKFQDWKAQNAPNDSGFDYDLRGAFQAGVQPDAQTGHWPDTFKKPNHPTFSDQSQYAKDRPDLAGHWEGDTYYPAPSYINPPERQTPFPRPRMTEILSGFYETAKKALDLPNTPPWAVDPDTGEVHTSTQAIEKAADLAGLMTFGPAPVASKLAEGSLGSFAGVTSKTVDKNKLAQAQILESRGLPSGKIGDVRDYIWKKTGFFRGADNRWRYEIHDADMKLREEAFNKTIDGDKITYAPKGTGLPALKDNASLEDILDFMLKGRGKVQTLEQTIDHPELFKAYPELRGIKIQELPPEELAMGTRGMMLGKTLFLAPDLSKEEARSIIMHEVQHSIQNIEGFTRGGSSEMFRTKQLDEAEAFFKKVRTKTEKDIVASGFLPEEIAELKATIYDSLRGKRLGPGMKEALDAAKDSPNFIRLKNIVQAEIHLEDAAREHHALYRRLRGEVEARNVQARLYYERETKQLIPPYRSEEYDMPRMFQNEPPPPWGQGPMKSEVIPFRRGANDNMEKIPPREPNMIGSDEQEAFKEAWKKIVDEHFQETVQIPHEEFIKRYDELHAFGNKILADKKNWNEFNVAKYNKMGRELAKLQGNEWEDIKLNPLK